MRPFLSALLLLASWLPAQTCGVGGVNDLTVNGLGTTTCSCNALGWLGATPMLVTFDLSCAPFSPAVLCFGPACTPCWWPIPGPAAGCGVPAGTCPGTNLWLTFAPLICLPGMSDASGKASWLIPFPVLNAGSLAVQAAVVDPGCAAWGILVSQGHTFSWT